MEKSNEGQNAIYCTMCGVFYANQAFNGYCSKCFKDTQKDSADAEIINRKNRSNAICISTNPEILEEETKVDLKVVTVQQTPIQT